MLILKHLLGSAETEVLWVPFLYSPPALLTQAGELGRGTPTLWLWWVCECKG